MFPEAEVKVFLTATVDERARRRLAELVQAGTATDMEAVKGEVIERDRRDSTRPIAPLVQAKDAVVVDSSTLGVDEVVEAIAALVERVADQVVRVTMLALLLGLGCGARSASSACSARDGFAERRVAAGARIDAARRRRAASLRPRQ